MRNHSLLVFAPCLLATCRAFAPNRNKVSLYTPSSRSLLFLQKDPQQPDKANQSAIFESLISGDALKGDPSTIVDSIESTVIGGNEWVFYYADLSPDSEETAPGQAFLATNLAYAVAGVLITTVFADYWLGFWTDVCAVASFNYHYCQLAARGQEKVAAVRVALLIDYIGAAIAIGTTSYYLLTDQVWPVEAIAVTVFSLACLGASWIWESSRPYMFWHGMWHLAGGVAGYLIAQSHAQISQVL